MNCLAVLRPQLVLRLLHGVCVVQDSDMWASVSMVACSSPFAVLNQLGRLHQHIVHVIPVLARGM
jgi:hypothetical protein